MNVAFTKPVNKIRPQDHMSVLKAVLPRRYSPFRTNGNGVQTIYLTELSHDFAAVLAGLIGEEARLLVASAGTEIALDSGRIVTGDDLDVWERRLEEQVEADATVPETDRKVIYPGTTRARSL